MNYYDDYERKRAESKRISAMIVFYCLIAMGAMIIFQAISELIKNLPQ